VATKMNTKLKNIKVILSISFLSFFYINSNYIGFSSSIKSINLLHLLF